jgi:di/tricarboxylate transporter
VEHLLILALVVGALVLFALEIVRPDLVALGVTLVLLLTGTVSAAEGFSGFSNPAVITVIAMFILSSGLIRTGVADLLADGIARLGGGSATWLTIVVMAAVGAMSAFMNNIGATAILLPAMFAIAERTDYPVGRLLMPLAFGSLLGGLVTVIGTPPNLLVAIALEEAGFAPFRMFDFLPTGLAVMAAGTLYMATLGRRLIPRRGPAESLTQRYALADYVTEVVIPDKSPLVGRTLKQAELPKRFGLSVLRLRRADGSRPPFAPAPSTALAAGDRLIVEGNVEPLLAAQGNAELQLYAAAKFSDETLAAEGLQLAEVALAPGSALVGRSINQGNLRRRFDVLVLALRRRGVALAQKFTSVPLEVGDVLLVQGGPEAIDEVARSADFLVANKLEHAARDRARAPAAVAIMALTIVTAATGLLHISVAAMLGVLLMALAGCVRVQDMYAAVEWRVIFLIACMMPLGIALDDRHTGTACWLAEWVVDATGDLGPHVALATLFLFTALVTSVMSNAAAVVLLAPIAIAIAGGFGLEPYPFLMTIAIAASSAFLTPIGHQANVLVYGVGNYRFADFPRVGAPLTAIVFAVTLLVVPLVWPFTPLAS